MATTIEQEFTLQSLLTQYQIELQPIRPIQGIQCYRVVDVDPSGATEQDDRFCWGIAEQVAPNRWVVLQGDWHYFNSLHESIEFMFT